MIRNSFLFSVILCFIISIPLHSQAVIRKVPKGEESWRYLIKAQDAFDEGNYGDAVKYAETASSRQKQRSDWETNMLENLLKKREIRKNINSLEEILIQLKELELHEQIEIIENRIDEFGADSFGNDLQTLIEKEAYYSHCPEADFLLARIYRLEGEFELCFQYLTKAWNYHLNLRVPEQRFDILYELAQICHDMEDDDGYEKYLLLIMTENPFYTDENFMNAIIRFAQADNADGVEKFFMLYRNDSYRSLSALSALSQFYDEKKAGDKAMKCAALGCIIALTKIEETLKNRIIDYEYKTFAETIRLASSYSDIMEWAGKNGIWQLYLTLASSCVASGKINFGTRLYQILAVSLEDSYWKSMAESRLVH